MICFIKRLFSFGLACFFFLSPMCAGALAEPLAGGWSLFSDFPAAELPEALQKGFDDNFGLVGASYQPVLYLGTQTVAGLNHLVLCKITMVTAEPVEIFALVVVYEDLAGDVTLFSTNSIDFVSLIEE